jgi:hypothetical protein
MTEEGTLSIVRHDSQRSPSQQPRSHALWVHAREVRGKAETRLEEFALLLEETALVVGASHQLLKECHE